MVRNLLNRVVTYTMLVCLISACGKSSSGYGSAGGNNNGGYNNPPGSTAAAVNITGMAFSPSTLTVKAGTTVTWTNNDNMTHTVTSDDSNGFNSGDMTNTKTYSYTFSTAGTYSYHCYYHSGMTGTVTV